MTSAAMPTLYSMPSLETAGALKSGIDIMDTMGEMDNHDLLFGLGGLGPLPESVTPRSATWATICWTCMRISSPSLHRVRFIVSWSSLTNLTQS